MKDYVYDIESYPNIFTMTIKESDKWWYFEISHRRNDIDAIIQLLTAIRYYGDWMIGYNNLSYDYPVLHFIINNRPCAELIYNKSISIIKSEDKFSHIIWDRDQYVKQVDLYKIHHFDNPAKYTSLKMLEFNMRSQSIQDLPFPPGTHLTDEEFDILLQYNGKDVLETALFLEETRDEIAFRETLSKKYKKNFINFSDVKIGAEYFKIALGGLRNTGGTPRDYIKIDDIVLPYIKFKKPQFQAVQDWFRRQTITETNSAFSKIPEHSLGSLFQYCKTKTTRKRGNVFVPLSWREEKNGTVWTYWNQAQNLNCTIDGFQFDFGTGGLHGSIDSQTVISDEEGVIVDVDVTSYYPSIAISNRLSPAHIGENWCNIYGEMKKERLSYEKGTVENLMLKLALNGTFGATGSPYSPFYDTQYTMAITINGQLLLCLLADYLMDITGLKMIQANTDGLTFKCPHGQLGYMRQICKWWEAYTLLDLEEVQYSRMFIRDVNNYVAEVAGSGKLKKKGAYVDDLSWHQNQSSKVIQKAACEYLVNGTDVRQFIYNHNNPMDFLLRTKVPRTSKLMYGDRQIQNITRYYISNDGQPLIKIMPPLAKKPGVYRNIGINVGWLTTECNEWNGTLPNINYEFYIKEVEKLVKPLD